MANGTSMEQIQMIRNIMILMIPLTYFCSCGFEVKATKGTSFSLVLESFSFAIFWCAPQVEKSIKGTLSVFRFEPFCRFGVLSFIKVSCLMLQLDKRMTRAAHRNKTANSYSLLIATLIALYSHRSCACALDHWGVL
jgi:hypothetical protein